MVTVLAQIAINEDEPEALAEYFSITAPLLEKAGARIINRFQISEVVVGRSVVKTVLLVEYPDHQAPVDLFRSPEYAAARPARDRAFDYYNVSICATDEFDEISGAPQKEADDPP